MGIAFFFISGLVFLIIGAHLLIKGGVSLALRLGISSLVIGLTIIAYGTSAPEMAISFKSAFLGQSDIALGNVIGSNIFNVLCILGVAALFSSLVVARQLVVIDVPIMIAVSIILYLFCLDGVLSKFEGSLFCLGLISYTIFAIRLAKKDNQIKKEDDLPYQRKEIFINSCLCILGLIFLVFGARWFVSASIDIARLLGVSDLVIALTIIAGGTSLPELATSIVAAFRKQGDIAVGNVVGSNIFNILGILGISSVLAPAGGIKVSLNANQFDVPILLASAIACLPIFVTGHKITRLEGAVFLFYYAMYVIYLFLRTENAPQLDLFNQAMLFFVIPMTIITFLFIYTRKQVNQKASL